MTLGDRGNNQLGNYCQPIESQRLPTRKEVDSRDYIAYSGKSLRIGLDGAIPADNPALDGVVSHVFTYGHRNTQGIDFGPDGTLYGSEHGPKTDDEINILTSGGNYGWPNVAGLRDGNAYEYARWAESTAPCSEIRFSDLAIHPSVPREPESAFTKPFIPPIATMFTVPTGYNFQDPLCKGVNYICWPTVGASSIEYYESKGGGIPGWEKVLFVTTLKRGSLYVAALSADGKSVKSPMSRYFQSEDRFRDTAVSADRRTIYVATDSSGLVEALNGGATSRMANPGAILAFTYEREGSASDAQPAISGNRSAPSPSDPAPRRAAAGPPPRFTAAQAKEGKTAYDASCAVCHGSTMMNGTMGTPLAGEFFEKRWSGKNVKALYDKTRTMPPNAKNSLKPAVYANILAYMFEVNGVAPGEKALPAGGRTLEGMIVP
jgi:cytochrome c5